MITDKCSDIEPNFLVNTKRQIFSSENESHIHLTNKQNSLAEQDDVSSQEKNIHFIELIQSRSSAIRTVKIISPEDFGTLKQHRGSLCFQSSLHNNEKYLFPLIKSLNPTWKKGGLKIIKYVARFIYQLKTKADKPKIKLMNLEIFKNLGDKSGDFSNFKRGKQREEENIVCSIFNKIVTFMVAIWNVICRYSNRLAIIYPESSFKIFWDSIVVCIIVINIFYIPMSLSFELDKSNQISILFFETIPSYIFIVEIMLNFNTAFYNQGIIHTNRSEIFFHYIQNNFCWDLLITIPFVLAQFDIPYIQFILLLRIARVRSMIQNVQDLLNAKEEVQAVLEMIKLVYFLVLVAHMCSCGWHLLGRIEYEIYNDERSWLIYYDYYDKQWYDRYIVSLYWSVITTLTVGYGDIVPQTTIERLFVIIVAMVLCGVFGYIISTIGEIIKTLEERKAFLKRSLKKVNQYIKQKQLNLQLSLKVRKYFEFKHQIDEQLQEQDDSILNKLSGQLKQEVLVDIYKRVLLKSNFLKNNIPDELINNLCQKTKQATYAPGCDIASVNDTATKLIFILEGQVDSYFVSKGLEALCKGEKENAISKLQKVYQKGDVIGELEFVLNSSYQYNFRASSLLQIAFIDRNDFLAIISENEECRQKFHQTREKLTYQKTYGKTCDICKWTHKYQDCPFVFYQSNLDKIARNANFNLYQYRKKFERQRDVKRKRQCSFRNIIVSQGLDLILNFGFLNEDQINDQYLAKLGYGVLEDEKSNQLSDSQLSLESQEADNISQEQRRRVQSFDKMKTSFLAQKLKTNYGLNQNYSKNVFTEDQQQTLLQNRRVELKHQQEQIITGNSQKISQNIYSQNPTRQSKLLKLDTIIQKSGSLGSQQLDNKSKNATDYETNQLSQSGQNFIIELDQMKDYEFYFPIFNVTNVVEVLRKQRLGLLKINKKQDLQDKLRALRMNKSQNKINIPSSKNLEEKM
ncbi:unnamed protein product (macronuclear) [Paramecium tetraurelia]|uniref:Cyclic nucleotide-binding domain-containing protein n=1 Tax=Paramecium tetraurelia TaxID=5888 RepID=A0CVK8_PARTE|nr:uncharacterized protein GSPATT00010993001 [Paramecium tetraurelia]CAK74825.1 unnamed protein product [Paramecium tetraurelia]|eukprot:XP_001442222.1 hypothetical protein (macronuclear) [Paramecium tetraurelia strain d4-2]